VNVGWRGHGMKRRGFECHTEAEPIPLLC